MCVSCGCGKMEDKHGDERNITMSQLSQAAKAANVSLKDVGDNVAKATAGEKEKAAS